MGVGSNGKVGWGSIECNHDFSAYVSVDVIIVVEFRRRNSVANENCLCLNCRIWIKIVASGDEVISELQRLFLPIDFQREGSFVAVERDCPEAHFLEICAAVASGFQSHFLELGGNVLGGEHVAASSGPTAFEEVVGQVSHLRADGVGVDFGQQICRRI